MPEMTKAAEEAQQAVVAEAFALYMRYAPLAKIVSLTGIDLTDLKSAVFATGGWKDQRQALYKEMNEEIKQSQLAKLKKVTNVGISLIEMALDREFEESQELDKNGKKNGVSLNKASQIGELFSRMHKAKLLEEVTDPNAGSGTISPMEIIKAFADDPYLRPAIDEADTVYEEDNDIDEAIGLSDNPDSRSLSDSNRPAISEASSASEDPK